VLVPDYISTRDQQVSFLYIRVGTVNGSTCLLLLLSGSAEDCDHPWILMANSHLSCRVHAMLCRGLEKLLLERHCRGTAWAWHGKCESHRAALCKSSGKDTI
jgi:hypothetical protein